MSEDIKEQVYQKYVIKCAVFQRDNFKCQNKYCKTPDSKLTLHHIKFQKNKGKHSLKNGITICKTCHKAYHRGKASLTFNGMTYRIHKEEQINWKKVKERSKEIRKANKEYHGIKISWELLRILMRFLFDIKIKETGEDD